MSETGHPETPNSSTPREAGEDFKIQLAEDSHIFEDSRVHKGFESLLNQLKPHLENGEYSVIVGDDKSGRIPTLVVRRIAKRVYESRGSTVPQALFYNSPRNDEVSNVEAVEAAEVFRKRLRKIKEDNPSGKVLIVTDAIVGGDHVGNLSKVVGEEGLGYDIATLGLTSTMTPERLLSSYKLYTGRDLLPPGGNLFVGLPYNVHHYSSPAATGLVEDSSIAPSKDTPSSEKRRVIRNQYTEPIDYKEISKTFPKPVIIETYTANQYKQVREGLKRFSDELYSSIFKPRGIDAIIQTTRRLFLRK